MSLQYIEENECSAAVLQLLIGQPSPKRSASSISESSDEVSSQSDKLMRFGANRAIGFTIDYFLELPHLVLGVLAFEERLFNFFLLLDVAPTGFIAPIGFGAIVGKAIALNPTFGLVVGTGGGAGKAIAV